MKEDACTSVVWRVSLASIMAAVLAAWATLAITVTSAPAGATDVSSSQQTLTAQQLAELRNVGSTRALEILPLVDWNVAAPGLIGEAGVSYLVRTDRNTILFDVGGNLAFAETSPLVANMRQLGIGLADIDTIVISHNHVDHVGGRQFAQAMTFSLGSKQVALQGKRVYVPIAMTYPGSQPVVAREPTVIAPGVATMGAITGKLQMGPVDEQALAIRVEGKGVVLIVGCGHQGLPRLLQRSAELFNEPIYGVIGGLHYPVPRGRLITGGVDLQRRAVYGLGDGPSLADIRLEIDLLSTKGPQWVSLSAHDSSDEVIEAFRKTFGARYHDLRVGELQVIAGTKQ